MTSRENVKQRAWSMSETWAVDATYATSPSSCS